MCDSPKKKFIEDFNINNGNGYKGREVYIIKNHPQVHVEIKKIDSENWFEKLYKYINSIKEAPICKLCGGNVMFYNVRKGYATYCSMDCRNKDNDLKLIGDKNPMKNKNVVDKSKKTKLIKYGDEHYNNKEQQYKTKEKKYDDKYYNNRLKARKTSLYKYGTENYTNRELAKKTSFNKYDDEYYNNRKKHVKTNNEKYGIEYYNNRELAKKTSFNKYGVVHHTQSKKYKEARFVKTINQWANKLNINVDDIKYNGDTYIINNYCNSHDSFNINKYVLRNRLNYGISNICTICNPVSENSSIKEGEIRNFIENELNLNTQKIKINNKEIDIFIPGKKKLGIEFNGLYWHSHLNLDSNYHLNKLDIMNENSIYLLNIFENEWIHKKEIVKSIIKSKLDIFNNKIYGRKTHVIEITNNKLVREFLETNHIQGFVGSKVKLGLFHENELVGLMTFGKKRIAMGSKTSLDGEYEMLRFCNKLNTQIVGGASKLFKYFIKNYQPKSIITYADRRYSMGELYKTLGFDHIGNTEPNYWYFKSHEYILHYRFKFRKDVLVREGFDASKTEHQIMDERGYMRIYDCGNMKFEFKLG